MENINVPNYKLPKGQRVIYKKHAKDFEGATDNSPRQNYNEWFPNKATQIKWYTDPVFHAHNENSKDNNLYTYRQVSPNEIYKKQIKLKRASYIPYILGKSGERYWLLGSFIDFPEIKVDFGGKCKNENPHDCSVRELNEETHGVLVKPIETALKDGRATVFKGTNNKGMTTFFIMVNMTGKLDELDEIQEDINIASVYYPVSDEDFGPLGFYREKELIEGTDSKTGQNIYTAFALTDFITKIKMSRKTGNPLF